MISYISTGDSSRFLHTYTSTSSIYFSNFVPTAPGIPGQVRFNPNTKSLEVCTDNNYWLALSNPCSLELSKECRDTLDWATKKRQEENQLLKIAEDNATIKGLLDERKNIDDKLSLVLELLK